MKKILLLAIFIFYLTGCSATYNIEIYNDKVKENMDYIEINLDIINKSYNDIYTYSDIIKYSTEYPYPAFYNSTLNENDNIKLDGVEYYENKLIDKNGLLGQRLSYNKFKLSNFNESFIVNSCYQYFNILDEDDTYVISTSLKNNCFDQYPLLDDITINLKTNHKVVSSNADKVSGYHYTWNIKKELKDDASIMITLKKNDYVFNYENEFIKKIFPIIIIIGIISLVIFSLYNFFKNKNDNANEI